VATLSEWGKFELFSAILITHALSDILLSQGFASWRAFPSHKVKLRKALMHLRYTTASKAFATWRACAAALAQHARQLQDAMLLWTHRTEAAAFRAWVQHLAVRQSQMQMVHYRSPCCLLAPGSPFWAASHMRLQEKGPKMLRKKLPCNAVPREESSRRTLQVKSFGAAFI